MTITRTEVDGVPTLVAPVDGPMTAGLVFRVGRADETLARAGVTHLIEHLALHGLGMTDYHFNGATSPVTTTFQLQGTESDVVAFLNGVCGALADLPVGRLAVEKEILRTEEAGRGGSVAEPMALWRYGARGHGVVGFPEFGLSALTADDLREWTARWFTRANAMLWIAGDRVPAGLRLTLPDGGARMPAPAVTSALPVTPAFFSGPSERTVAYEGIVRRGTAAGVFAGVLERALFRALRQEGGYSYHVAADYLPRDAEHASVFALADMLPEKRGQLLGEFVDVLAALRYGRVAKADVDAFVTTAEAALSSTDAEARSLPGRVQSELLGYDPPTLAEYRAQLRAVTPEDVAEVAAEAHASSLLMVPDGRGPDWAGFTAAPTQSSRAVYGDRHPLLANRSQAMITGPEGVSLQGGGSLVTVRFGEVAAMLAWPDGARRLIGFDAITVHVEPTLFAGGPAALAEIDAAVRPELRVDLPARDPENVPQPPSPARRARRRTGPVLHRAADRIASVPDGLRWTLIIALFLVNIRLIDALDGNTPLRVAVCSVILLLSLLLTDWAIKGLRRLARYVAR
ncbi:putative Zn-dependent peptidase [Catenuloplanes nepalensis]|uniref:Zn-dependent peptidase n=1 Tax=Catenuloplanes nepalensis TaxID=587533 RepID=A0ABT9N2L0_9ACTN|nr:insulinase family protein [Catenuloplanes nepalensis]MDP9797906.1 putative Zn-dependent peptidase [Catenuloplanes nepalensis]